MPLAKQAKKQRELLNAQRDRDLCRKMADASLAMFGKLGIYMEESFHFLIMANHFIFQKKLFSMIKDTELSLGQPKILDYLKDHNGSIQKDISAACHIEQASLTSVLNGMEKKGLIVRKMQDGNRRSLYVFLTEKGGELAERIAVEFEKIEKMAMEGFSDKEKEMLITLLSGIYRNICNNE